jgi:pimeloyl-ACP methyl ester carboxylesterase
VVEAPLLIGCQGAELPAILTRPAEPGRAAVILLHPADDPARRQFLFEHLALVLPEFDVAVLRYDRRACARDRDVPYLLQVDDLNRGREVLAREVGSVPTGVWGFSQGAWVALLAAADLELAFLVLVGCSAVPETPDWDDMDFDPADAIRRIRCLVLAFYGDDEWVPVGESIDIWRNCFPDPAQLAIHKLPGTAHHPTLNGGREISAISPEYTATLTRWLSNVAATADARHFSAPAGRDEPAPRWPR